MRRRHPSEEPGHIAQMERLFFYGKFSTMDEADWLRNEISICQNGLRTSKPGVQASPVTGKPLLASVAGHLNFQGVESPETVDAVGFQPTASILSAKVGGLEGIRTLDLSDANRTLSQLSYEPKSRYNYTPSASICKALFAKFFLKNKSHPPAGRRPVPERRPAIEKGPYISGSIPSTGWPFSVR